MLHASLPEPRELARFASIRLAMSNVASWLLLPSMALVVISGMLSMAASEVYKSAGWVWAKLATGVLILEGTLVSVQGPMERAGKLAASVLAGEGDVEKLGSTLSPEWISLWVILGVALANIVLAVFRPQFSRRKGASPEK